jgi:hypothetical protein
MPGIEQVVKKRLIETQRSGLMVHLLQALPSFSASLGTTYTHTAEHQFVNGATCMVSYTRNRASYARKDLMPLPDIANYLMLSIVIQQLPARSMVDGDGKPVCDRLDGDND